jgi:tRNA pseudouridine13 synthase
MLQQDFAGAVDRIMAGRLIARAFDVPEPPGVQKVRQTWRETGGDPYLTSKVLPRGSGLARERLILKGLKRYGDPLLAIRCLHFHERMFWISAYQAYVWNVMASKRLSLYGASVVTGDLIDEDGVVRIVDDSFLSSKCLRFEDVVLPLPGYDVQYPSHKVGEYYRDLLERDGVDFRKDAPPESTAKGDYRKLVTRAYNFTFEPTARNNDGQQLDVKLKFDLPTGSYATMLLRELMLTTVVRNNPDTAPFNS